MSSVGSRFDLITSRILSGDVVRVSLWGGQNIIYLNSEKTAIELLEKRSNIYSDRPILPLLNNKCVASSPHSLTLFLITVLEAVSNGTSGFIRMAIYGGATGKRWRTSLEARKTSATEKCKKM